MNDGRLLVRLPAAGLARIDRLVGEGNRSAWVRGLIEDALVAGERQARISAELAVVTAVEKQAAAAAETRRQEAMERMRRNGK